MGRKKIIVVDTFETKHGSQGQTLQALNDCMALGGAVYGGLKDTGKFILSKRGRKRQPSLAESIRTGRDPEVKF